MMPRFLLLLVGGWWGIVRRSPCFYHVFLVAYSSTRTEAIFGGASKPVIFANIIGLATGSSDEQVIQQGEQQYESYSVPQESRGASSVPPPPMRTKDGSAIQNRIQAHSQQGKHSNEWAQQQISEGQGIQQYQQGTPPLRPPAPPQLHSDRRDIPPPPPFDGQSFRSQPDPSNGPPNEFDPHFIHHQQQQQQYGDAILEAEIGLSFQREQALLDQLHNLTITLNTLEQRDEIHLRQLDVLTERIMEVEATSSREHNALLEYQANCTAMSKQIALLHGQIEEWESRCNSITEQHDTDEIEKRNIKQQLKDMSLKAEELAALIERFRLEEDSDMYSSRTNAKKKEKKKTNSGFFAWLFGSNYVDDENSDEDRDVMYDEARSTLIEALQRERNNVDDLENVLTNLQKNNSVIIEQLSSRDLIIAELNDRVAVFEEDKSVLKAALRQLKKEINDEAPKTQTLVKELQDALAEISRVQSQIESIKVAHQKEISALNQIISQKQDTIVKMESNLTMIGTYVGKLEERLTDYAVARRDLEDRETKYQIAANATTQTKSELERLKGRLRGFESDQAELKLVLEELASERERLKTECLRLSSERDSMRSDVEMMQQTVKALNLEHSELTQQSSFWKSQAENHARDLNATTSNNRRLQEQLNSTALEMANLSVKLNSSVSARNELHGFLASAEAKNEALEAKLEEMQNDASWKQSNLTIELKAKVEELEKALRELATKNESSSIAQTPPDSAFADNIAEKDILFDVQNADVGPNTSLIASNYSAVPTSNKSSMDSNLQNRILPSPQPVEGMRNITLHAHRQGLPNSNITHQHQLVNKTSWPKRNVPFRHLRKGLAKITGVHGLLTPPSQPQKQRVVVRGPALSQQVNSTQLASKGPPPMRTGESQLRRPPPLNRTLTPVSKSAPPTTQQQANTMSGRV